MANRKKTTLTKYQQQLFLYLKTKSIGETLTKEEILRNTQWAPATLDAYRSKHYIDPFLKVEGRGIFRVLQNGSEITEATIAKAFTQVRPGLFVPTEGLELRSATGAYVLRERLGNGAVAQVWRCVFSVDKSERAAKIMTPREDLLDPKVLPDVRMRFAREAKYGRKLSHEHIVTHRDSGDIENHPYLIMDLATTTLAKELEERPLTVPESLLVIQHCLLGLEYLHAQGCLHRDIKPHNILKFGTRYVLGDLGIVKWSDLNPAFTSAGTMTTASIQLGSWQYMAPEQREAAHDAATPADVYALGMSWYEMLAKKLPDTAYVAAKRFPKATTVEPVEGLIRQMLSFVPDDRPTVLTLRTAVDKMIAEKLG